jgi:hypothetical protein
MESAFSMLQSRALSGKRAFSAAVETLLAALARLLRESAWLRLRSKLGVRSAVRFICALVGNDEDAGIGPDPDPDGGCRGGREGPWGSGPTDGRLPLLLARWRPAAQRDRDEAEREWEPMLARSCAKGFRKPIGQGIMFTSCSLVKTPSLVCCGRSTFCYALKD